MVGQSGYKVAGLWGYGAKVINLSPFHHSLLSGLKFDFAQQFLLLLDINTIRFAASRCFYKHLTRFSVAPESESLKAAIQPIQTFINLIHIPE